MTDDQIRQEDCRLAILYALYDRKAGAHSATTIHQLYLQRFDFSADEVNDAIAVLLSMDLIKSEREAIGASLSYQITGAGIRLREQKRTKH